MKRTPVTSSNIESIGFDIERQILEVEFKDGSIYHYYDIPVGLYLSLMKASSVGSYLAANVKGKFRYEKIT